MLKIGQKLHFFFKNRLFKLKSNRIDSQKAAIFARGEKFYFPKVAEISTLYAPKAGNNAAKNPNPNANKANQSSDIKKIAPENSYL